MSEIEKITYFLKKYKNNTTGYCRKLCEILIEHPEIMLEEDMPDTEILYYYMLQENIVVTEISLNSFKKKTMAISTIRNFRKKVRDYLEGNGVALETAEHMRKKGAIVKCKISKGII